MKWLRSFVSKLKSNKTTATITAAAKAPETTLSSAGVHNSRPIPEPILPLPQAPNEIEAVINHFSQLLPGLVGAIIAVLITALSKDFPSKVILEPIYCSQVVVTLSILAGFLFYDGVQKSYFAQTRNVAAMDEKARVVVFKGVDPFSHYDNEIWRAIIDGYIDQARCFSRKAIWRLEIGSILLFYSIALVMYAYFFWLGILGLVLVTAYSVIDAVGIMTHIRAEKAAQRITPKPPNPA